MAFRDLRRGVAGEIFDYQMLMHHLKEYKKPRDKVTLLLKEVAIIRIKKGLYIFGPDYQRRPISHEILANLIYSPSYISLEYALAKYSLIPERTFTVTNISINRARTFKTPVGMFIYQTRSLTVYPIGIKRIEVPHEGCYLIAEPEKALIDLVSQVKGIKDVAEMHEYLYENMRMEQSDLKKLNKKLLNEIIDAYNIPKILVQAIYD